MFKALLLAGSLFLTSASLPTQPAVPAAHRTTTAAVYVCMSKGSVAYHATNECSGLNRCNHEVQSMSTTAAEELGKRACLKCF
ncbi:hypothetical protein [Hymenobacter canadensis]|uniref:Uncharacterized protein n=1 Tax=Hymenobacter canadensis TaxID=2999067 RepID=A0ABY7LYE7_9BACT|nr:hypothetical protein [Hymenobacter canadensis]WBA44290.1 hypothetical protein O3303_21685 [Hymenobacter canadensis]